MAEHLRAYLKEQSSQTVKLSQQAVQAAQFQNFVEAQALMKQAAQAERNCLEMLKPSTLEEG